MLIKRNLYAEIKNHLKAKEITMLVGPRQVGKTTLLIELSKYLKKEGENVVSLNLDYENDKRFFESQDLLLKKINLEIGQQGYVFIDEIQRKENTGLFLKGIYDLNLPYKFVVTGSGSLELKEKIQESLIGRKRLFKLLPVSFLEFINYKTEYKYVDKLDSFLELEQNKLEILLNEYLSFGGYPRIITEENIEEKRKLMDEIYGSYIQRDIIGLLNIDRSETFDLMIKILASQTGKLINYSHLTNLIGISIPTLKKYLFFAEKTFVIQTISPYFTNPIKELTKSQAIYFYDIGLRNFANGNFTLIQNQNELGFLFQNFIKNIIEEKIIWKNWTLHFWRTKDKAEVGFVLDKGNELIPIEIKYSKTGSVTRSLRSFIEKYSPRRAYIINKNQSEHISIHNTEIIFIPYYKLLTNNIFE